jgi:transcriptional antiterminator RfaH
VNGDNSSVNDVQTMAGDWFVVRSKPRREEYAQRQLIRRGVETFLPRIAERARSRVEPVVNPLFPGYLFARVDLETQYTAVIWTPGVHSMVAFGGAPAPLEPQVIEFLQKRCGGQGLIVATPHFEAGQEVRVVDGPLAGLHGIVQERVSGRARVRVLMELLRRRTQVTLPLDLLERVAS